ncbi:MYND-type domain-containing protein [Mycena venus]|uniref:MYND-type domain-containing protein n=1 Tax=Mycena venus TaxID=2733690 RepID=A0A8H6Z3T5_9AGAR|nr:MYND-type domain-containing protein [Mycena venus]
MAAGTEKVYKLDLEDIIAFPDTAHVPFLPPNPGESWIIFGEIVQDNSFARPVFLVRDKIDCCFPVAFYTDNPDRDAADCKIGHILCITSGMRHNFLDGSNGYRIEDPSTVFYTSPEKFPVYHGNSRVAIAAIHVALGVLQSDDAMAAALEVPRQIFTSRGYLRGLPLCDRVMADFLIAQGRTSEAIRMYEKWVLSSRGKSAESFSKYLLALGDITLRHDMESTTHWATICLAYGRTAANLSVVAWAFRLLGDIFREEADEETSGSLFQLALEEFTRMDIYQGRAQCLLRLANIARKRGEHIVATEYLSEAKEMFLKSGMAAEAKKIEVLRNQIVGVHWR